MSKIGVTVHPSFAANRPAAQGPFAYRTPRGVFEKLAADRSSSSSADRDARFGAMWTALIAFAISAGALTAVLFHVLR